MEKQAGGLKSNASRQIPQSWKPPSPIEPLWEFLCGSQEQGLVYKQDYRSQQPGSWRPSVAVTKAGVGNQQHDIRAHSVTIKNYEPMHTNKNLLHDRGGKGCWDQRNTFFWHHSVEATKLTSGKCLRKCFHCLLFKNDNKQPSKISQKIKVQDQMASSVNSTKHSKKTWYPPFSKSSKKKLKRQYFLTHFMSPM